MKNGSERRAFSLVELVIVIVIIGVIAAIAVPRISRGAKGAGAAAVRGNLATLRNAIEVYAAEHGGEFPAFKDNLEATFVAQMTGKTDLAGTPGSGAGFIYGPYVRDIPILPVGPNAGKSPPPNGVIVAATGPTVDETNLTAAWTYNSVTGEIRANTDDPDENGDPYNTY
ncbi:MAG: prepilin-type N-terminal cleavage/methylation domain-containing protein [Phycisphaerae bacterium]